MRLCRSYSFHIAVLVILLASAFSVCAWSAESVLYKFGGSSGAFPYGGVINDTSGNLYGTTADGGVFTAGNVFELAYNGTTYSEITLYSFTGGTDGGFPTDSLIMDAAGNLYGTTNLGGTGNCFSTNSGCGVVFELVKSSGYAENVLYRFSGGTDGGMPIASLAFDSTGNLYGTTSCGGNNPCVNGAGGAGVVFELVKSSGYSHVVLHTFSGGSTDGANPSAPVILDGSGNLYGTTQFGGSSTCSGGCGVVFKLVKSSSYSETLLHIFTGFRDGGVPYAPVVADTSGNLYGTTTCGGRVQCSGGDGTVYEVSASGSFVILHAFSGKDGVAPMAGLTFDSTFSTLYGTAYSGGAYNLGTAFRLQKSGSSFSILHSYKGGSGDGAYPLSFLDLAAKGRCPSHCGIGITLEGGPGNVGVVFLLTSI